MEMQNRTTVREHPTTTPLATRRKTDDTKCKGGCRIPEDSTLLARMEIVHPIRKTMWHGLEKLHVTDPASLLFGTYAREMRHTKILLECSCMFTHSSPRLEAV